MTIENELVSATRSWQEAKQTLKRIKDDLASDPDEAERQHLLERRKRVERKIDGYRAEMDRLKAERDEALAQTRR